MHVLSQTEFIVSLLSVISAGLFIVVAMSRYANPLDEEIAHSIRESTDLLDSCAHTLDGKPVAQSAFMELGAGLQGPVDRLHPLPLWSEPGAARRGGAGDR